MVDYKKALQFGIELSKSKELEAQEIKSVLENLKSQILEASDGKINIDTSVLIFDKEGYLNKRPIRTETVELATFEVGMLGGYPCVLVYDDLYVVTEDKVALERALYGLIASVRAGRVFKRLLEVQDSNATDPI